MIIYKKIASPKYKMIIYKKIASPKYKILSL